MNVFIFTCDDNKIISDCIQKGHGSWGDVCLKDLKKRLKTHLLKKQGNICCYCFKNMHNEFLLVVDIEHILPKSMYVGQMFSIDNLAIACKRCNMDIKKSDTKFLIEKFNIITDATSSSSYQFIHPNFDNYTHHIKLVNIQENTSVLVKYQVLNSSLKGKFHYDYFKLSLLELKSVFIILCKPHD